MLNCLENFFRLQFPHSREKTFLFQIFYFNQAKLQFPHSREKTRKSQWGLQFPHSREKTEKKKEKPKNPFLILIDEHGTAPITGIDDFIRQIRSLFNSLIVGRKLTDGSCLNNPGPGFNSLIVGRKLLV